MPELLLRKKSPHHVLGFKRPPSSLPLFVLFLHPLFFGFCLDSLLRSRGNSHLTILNTFIFTWNGRKTTWACFLCTWMPRQLNGNLPILVLCSRPFVSLSPISKTTSASPVLLCSLQRLFTGLLWSLSAPLGGKDSMACLGNSGLLSPSPGLFPYHSQVSTALQGMREGDRKKDGS